MTNPDERRDALADEVRQLREAQNETESRVAVLESQYRNEMSAVDRLRDDLNTGLQKIADTTGFRKGVIFTVTTIIAIAAVVVAVLGGGDGAP